ncbi:MAG: hypothetical protein O7A98_00285 [Acidobacteria bacterium]|nr:hypothetical protein [Acidobacteriota bacterium]
MPGAVGIFFLFLLALAAGSLSTLFWIPEDDLGRGYFQTNALIVLGLLGLATALLLFDGVAPFGDSATAGRWAVLSALAAAFGYYAGVWRQTWHGARLAAGLTLAAATAALWLAGRALVVPLSALPYHQPLLAANLLTSALVLGWAVITMLLGHWYLVAPKLTFRHLIVYCWVLLGVVVARCVAVILTLTSAGLVDRFAEPNPWRLLTGFEGQGMFFWFRILWGLGIPLTLALMSLSCARQRSNQSATGILYVLVVGVLIGEITAYYLSATTGVPV